MDIYLILIYFC